MNLFYKLLLFLKGTMDTPNSFGWFHFLWIFLTIISIVVLYKRKDKHNEKELKIILFLYGFISLILEILKQIIWTIDYNQITNTLTFDYSWYSFPFQLCTTPIYVSLICLFLKDNKIRKSLLSYLAFTTILGSIATIIMPDSCFTEDILINIHTMYLHCGSLVLSVYLLIAKEVEINLTNLKNSIYVFLIFLGVALFLNIMIYQSGILNGETFNMFYISPYFISTLPVFNIIQQNVPYLIYLIIYIVAIVIGSLIIYSIAKGIQSIFNYKKENKTDR
ncbi:MAG: YwaF family protein [Bacilli bacterium]|nr:YwaF family protein [Bacilli bacterium]